MRKKLTAAVLALAMLVSLAPAALAAPAEAMPTNDKLTVDGVVQNPTVYKIGGSNYFKIRDLAAILNGTSKQFGVGYDSAAKSVTATTGQGYTKQDSDLAGPPAGGNKTAIPSNDAIYVNGAPIQAEVYKIDGSNYFKLRDLGDALGFAVDWSKEQGMIIDTSKTPSQSGKPTVKPVTEFTLEDLQGIWYLNLDGLFQQEIEINGNQFKQTYIGSNASNCTYQTATIVSVKTNYDPSGEGNSEDITPLYVELKDETETTVEDGTVTTKKYETSQRYFYDTEEEIGVFTIGAGVPFRRASALKLYPQYQAALEAAQSQPAQPANPLDLFQGAWKGSYQSADGEAVSEELILTGDQFERVGVYNGAYYYTKGTALVQTNMVNSSDGITYPYVLTLTAKEGLGSDRTMQPHEETSYYYVKSVDSNAGQINWHFSTFTKINPAASDSIYTAVQAILAAGPSKPSTPVITDVNPKDYAYISIKYLHDHLKFPSTMNVMWVYCGAHDRSGYNGEIINNTDQYYAVSIMYQAMNSLGVMKTNTFVSLYNLTTGDVIHDLKGYAEAITESAWGARKSYGYQLQNEALALGNRSGFSSTFTKEEIQSMVDRIKK